RQARTADVDDPPALAVDVDVVQPARRRLDQELQLARRERGIRLDEERGERRHDRRREARAVDVLVGPGDDVVVADLRQYQLAQERRLERDRGVELRVDAAPRLELA